MNGKAKGLPWAGGLALVAVIACGSWLLLRKPEESGRQTLRPDSHSDSADAAESLYEFDASDPESTTERGEAPHSLSGPEVRSPILAATLEGLVLSESGLPISEATLTWTLLNPSACAPGRGLTGEQRSTLASQSRTAVSDASGRFQFSEAPRGDGDSSVLWVTAAGYGAVATRVDPAHSQDLLLRLSATPQRDVIVVDSSGAPVSGALVEHFGAFAIDREYGNPWMVAAALAFRRVSTTDSEGRPQPPLYPSSAGESIQAQSGTELSDTWFEPRTGANVPIQLVISPSFTCFGQVRSSSADLRMEGLLVDAYSIGSTYSGSMAAATVRADGSWGPIEVPCRDGWEYILALAGPGIANDRISIGRPGVGDRVQHDFEATPELVLSVLVTNGAADPVHGAQVIAQWARGDFGVSSYKKTSEDGLAEIGNVMPGWVQLSVTAEGHTEYRGDWVEYLAAPENPIEVELEPSRSVRGRVIGGDEPIEDFRVVWWTARSLSASVTTRVDFEGRTDGTFELESAPRDTIWLMAAADGFSRSGFVRADDGAEDEVVLELMSACSARGIVVDAESGDPIAGSSVQLWMNRGNFYLDARSAPVVVDAEGRFVLEGLAPGDNRLVVEAPGYSRYLAVAFGEPGHDVDMGAIAMQRTRELALVLVGDGPIDTTGFVANLKGTRYHEPVTFDADGVARFENVSPGIATWRVDGPDGFLRREIHVLAPDAEWVFEVQAEGGPVLEVEVVSPSGGAVPRGLVLTAFAAPGAGVATPGLENLAWVAVDDEGRALVRGLPAGPVAVEVQDEDGAVSGAHGVLEPDGSRLEVLWSPRTHDFRVEDEAGRPVSEADVFLLPGDQATTWNAAGPTDDSGRVTIAGLPFDDVLVGAKHPELGMLPVRRVRLSEEGGSTTLRFGARSGLDVLLLEGGAPSPGTQVSLFTGGSFVVGDIASDGDGRLRWPNLAEGLYDLRVVHPGFWPGHARVATADDGEPVELTIHRRGSIELRLVTGADKPVAGQALELEHLGLGETPADWVGLGLLSGAAAQTASDGQGRVAIEGWPRGTYAWRAERPDGTSASGQFELAPGANAALELRLP